MAHFGLLHPSPTRRRLAATLIALLIPVLAAYPARSQSQKTTPATPAITVNIFNERHAISPLVYGGNFPEGDPFIGTTGTRLCRWGGNIATSYNWKLHLHNTAADWYFENFGNVDSVNWVRRVENAGSAAIVGIPMVDWTPKAAGLSSFSIKKYGPQQKTDPERPHAGNGLTLDGKPIRNDPQDAYVPLLDRPSPSDPPGSIYRSEWIGQLKGAFGAYPHLYEFDNEPEIWNGTHRDIHPEPSTYEEMRDKFLRMARLIKAIDPAAQVAGPTVCGWWFYWNSAAGPSDKAAHGGVDYLPWWLGEVAGADRKSGRRTLDVFDIHAYPDYDTNGPPDAVDAKRMRAPRGYWDPTFLSEGGVGTKSDATATQPDMNATAIIPRFRAMVNTLYPGTQFAITEWLYGDDNSVSAALADADTYGTFGREEVDLATRFCSPKPNTLGSLAIEMYKGFAPLSVEDRTNVNPDLFTSYAALSPDGKRLTVMAINKDPKSSVTAKIHLVGFRPRTMTVSARSGRDTSITASPATAVPDSFTFLPFSQTLLVFEGSAAPAAVDWSLDPNALMMVTGGHATLRVRTGDRRGVRITSVQAAPGVTITPRRPRFADGQPNLIDVAAGAKTGFYRFTVIGRTPSGQQEKQSGWVVVGAPGSLPATSGR